MEFNFKKPVSIKHKKYPESLLDIRVMDLLCGRVHNVGAKEQELLDAYKRTGYKYGRLSDKEVKNFSRVHEVTAQNLTDNTPVFIACLKYKGSKYRYVWCDSFNLPILLAYIKAYGADVTLRDIPIVVVYLGENEDTVYGEDNRIMSDFANIGVLVEKAYRCLEYTDSKKIYSIGYTIGDFMRANRELLGFEVSYD